MLELWGEIAMHARDRGQIRTPAEENYHSILSGLSALTVAVEHPSSAMDMIYARKSVLTALSDGAWELSLYLQDNATAIHTIASAFRAFPDIFEEFVRRDRDSARLIVGALNGSGWLFNNPILLEAPGFGGLDSGTFNSRGGCVLGL